MLKTSGSRRRYVDNGTYADDRIPRATSFHEEDLPKHESIKNTREFYNGKINYSLLKRFLQTQVGKPWELVQAEILNRIPTRLMHHKEIIYWFVADQVELVNGRLWNRRSNRFIATKNTFESFETTEQVDFYVNPESGILVKTG